MASRAFAGHAMRKGVIARLEGVSPQIVELRQEIERVARSDAKILITGESGVGKEVVAQCVHANSPRAHSTFVAVNCGGMPETLLESELFGHVRGSFTGAYRDKPGKLELAEYARPSSERTLLTIREVNPPPPRIRFITIIGK